jgi:hypothetical protein
LLKPFEEFENETNKKDVDGDNELKQSEPNMKRSRLKKVRKTN